MSPSAATPRDRQLDPVLLWLAVVSVVSVAVLGSEFGGPGYRTTGASSAPRSGSWTGPGQPLAAAMLDIGEEFAVLLPATGSAGAQQSAEALRIAVGQVGVDTPTGTLPVTVSVGVAQLRPDDDVVSLLARADAALYLAKSEGRDRVRQA